jgi:hypothetical protein
MAQSRTTSECDLFDADDEADLNGKTSKEGDLIPRNLTSRCE